MDLATPEMGVHHVAPASRVDDVATVRGVDEVVARAAPQLVVLRGRLAARLVVPPQHVALVAGVDQVVAVAAEELVVARAPEAGDAPLADPSDRPRLKVTHDREEWTPSHE